MTTSVFTQFDLIQYFASLDPYSYSVDNRPLVDLKQNVDVLGKAHDAALDAAKLAAVATGMVARGIVGENVMVGKKSLGSMNLVIDHGVFVKEGAVYASDINSQLFPKMGLQQQGVVFSLTAPLNINEIRYFTISARFKAPDNTLSFYDTTNLNTVNSVEIGTVEYDSIEVNTVAGVFNTSHFPPPTDPGFSVLFHVAVPVGTVSLTQDMVTNVNFVDDLTRAYDSYSTTTTGAANIDNITVNANYALVFVDGVFQNSSQYTILSPDEVSFSPALPSGLNVDFVTLRGGGAGGGGGATTYDYQDDSFTVPVGPPQSVFPVSSPLDSDFVFVFVNGIFQRDVDRTTPGQITLPSPVPAGTIVDFVQTVGGIALPLGGSSGQSVHKSGAGPTDSWQTEVLTVNVNSASGAGPLAYVSVPIGFNETYDLYAGRQILLVNNGGFSSIPTNGAGTPTVTLQVGGLGALPVTRPGNLPLKNNDIYSGAVVVYKTAPSNHFELVSPGMPDVVSTFTTVIGDQNDIEVTPNFPMLLVPNGTLFSIRPVNALPSGSTQEVCTLKVNFATGSLTRPIGKLDGISVVGLRPGDIQGNRNHLFQYDFALGYFILLNPASIPVVEVSGAKRQTVLTGQIGGNYKSFTQVNSPVPSSTDVSLPGVDPYALGMNIFGPIHNLRVHSGTVLSFASGFDHKGPVDYVETLPGTTVVADMALLGHGITSANISSIDKNSATNRLSISYSANVHTIPVNTWVRVRGMVGTATSPLVGANGVYCVEGVGPGPGNQLILSCLCDSSVLITSGIVNTVVDRVYFVYAERDDDGLVTFGLNTFRPLYIRGLSEQFTQPINMLTNPYLSIGQDIFDIDKMVMYNLQAGIPPNTGVLVPVKRVYVGEYYSPDPLTVPDDTFCRTYEYNGKYTAYIPSYNSILNQVYSFSAAPNAYSPFNILKHGMGTYMYTVKITALQGSLSAGRLVGAMMGGTPYYPLEGEMQANPYVIKRDPSQLSFALPSPGTSITSFGRYYSLASMSVNANLVIELERTF